MSIATKVYPKPGTYEAGVPHVVHELESKTAAESFVAAHHAFTLDAAEGIGNAPDGAELGIAPPVAEDASLDIPEPSSAIEAPSEEPTTAAGSTGEES